MCCALGIGRSQEPQGPTARIQGMLDAAMALADAKAKLAALDSAVRAARSSGDRYGEADGAFYSGQALKGLYLWKRAAVSFDRAATLYRAIGAKRDLGVALHELGVAYDFGGDRPLAVQAFRDALAAEEAAADVRGRGATLLALGKVYDDLGQRSDAFDACRKALALFEAREPQGRAAALNALGKLHEELGQRPEALSHYQQALELFQRAADSRGRAQTLTNMGVTVDNMGDPSRAIGLYEDALSLWGSDRSGMAATLNDLGKAHKELGRLDEALGYYERALAGRREIGDRQGEAITLNNIGRVHVEMGHPERALDLYSAALRLEREVGHREAEAITLRNTAYALHALKQPRLAVANAKMSVARFQDLRADLKALDPTFRRSYAAEVEPAYRFLAERLIDLGRLAEAEEVLGLLKDAEYFQFTRAGKGEKIDLTPREAAWQAQYEALGNALAREATEYDALVQLAKTDTLTEEQVRRKADLSDRLSAARVTFATFLKEAQQEFAAAGADDERLTALRTSTELARVVKELPGRPAAVYTLVTQDAVRLILTLPRLTELKDGQSSKIPFAELSRKVARFRTALTSPSCDPLPLAGELYDLLVRPIEGELRDAQVESLLWSLDGPLRYLPIGALYDRDTRQFLFQKFPCSLFTPSKLLGMMREPGANPSAVGFGVTEPHDVGEVHFDGLAGVGTELATLNRLFGASVYLDAAFTEDSLKNALEKSPQIVHVATHFQLKPGDASASFVLLGDGKPLAVTAFAKWMQGALDGVSLFVLSACDTATPVDDEADGGELESFARVAQENGADAVLATLWPVNDASTSLLMAKFYELRSRMSKLEALRQAQAWLMGASPGVLSGAVPQRAGYATRVDDTLPKYTPDPEHPFAHPYYWAPFVLTGNPR
ncbi:MAG: CHAT domain-containing protein [Fimbriimonadaceae bacterium]|nr:CHAT domain-containing protein [Fimbriimonadaceae bacterium]